MIFNPTIELDKKRAIERFKYFLSKGKTFELVEKKPKRSIRQNSYLHLILSWYAFEYGETMQYIKEEVFKKQINKDIFEYEFINRKTGEIRIEYKSTAHLDTGQMTTAINRFRNYASKEAGIYLPEPGALEMLQQIKNEVKNNQYL